MPSTALPITRPAALAALLAALALSACVEGSGTTGSGQPVTAAQACVSKAARLVKVPRESVTVTQALAYPEGDVVMLAIAGMGKLRCLVDVDGRTGELAWLEGGPGKPAPAG